VDIIHRPNIYTAAFLLKPRTVNPEKQPLLVNDLKQYSFLGNGRETNGTTSVARQQIFNKRV
jgi:hypothetical protein